MEGPGINHAGVACDSLPGPSFGIDFKGGV